MEQIIQFPSNGHQASGYLALPAQKGPGVVLIQEWWGLNDNIKAIAQQLAQAGFATLAPDLYYGQVASAPDEARRLAMQLGLQQAAQDMSGAIDALRPHCHGRIGVMGFCMGGGLALTLAALRPDLAACVPFYGLPRNRELDFSALQAKVMGHYGEQDAGIPLAEVESLEQKLLQLNKEVQFFRYPAGHAFFNREGRNFHAPSATLAWERTLAFLQQTLS